MDFSGFVETNGLSAEIVEVLSDSDLTTREALQEFATHFEADFATNLSRKLNLKQKGELRKALGKSFPNVPTPQSTNKVTQKDLQADQTINDCIKHLESNPMKSFLLTDAITASPNVNGNIENKPGTKPLYIRDYITNNKIINDYEENVVYGEEGGATLLLRTKNSKV